MRLLKVPQQCRIKVKHVIVIVPIRCTIQGCLKIQISIFVYAVTIIDGCAANICNRTNTLCENIIRMVLITDYTDINLIFADICRRRNFVLPLVILAESVLYLSADNIGLSGSIDKSLRLSGIYILN